MEKFQAKQDAANEIKQKVKDLNKLIESARSNNLKVSISLSSENSTWELLKVEISEKVIY